MKRLYSLAVSVWAVSAAWGFALGESLVWRNTGSDRPLASTAEKPLLESNFSFCIPATDALPAGTPVCLREIRLASVNGTFNGNLHSYNVDASYLMVDGVKSDLVAFGGADSIRSNAWTNDHALVYRFSTPCIVRAGTRYPAARDQDASTGLALLWSNGRPLYSRPSDRATCRYVACGQEAGCGVLASAARPGFEPVYEIRATLSAGVVTSPVTIRVGAGGAYDLCGTNVCRNLTLEGTGRLDLCDGPLSVEGKLTVVGRVEAHSSDLNLSSADVAVAEGASLTYVVDGERASVRSLSGPGRFVKRGVGELWVESLVERRKCLVGGGVTLGVDEGWVSVNGFNSDSAWGEATVVLSQEGDLGCYDQQVLDGPLTVRYDGPGDKVVFAGMGKGPVRLCGSGAFRQAGSGRVHIGSEWWVTGALEVESYLKFACGMSAEPASVSGTGTVDAGGDYVWTAADGMLSHLMTFDGTVRDAGPKPFVFRRAEANMRNFVPSPRNRAYRLNNSLQFRHQLVCRDAPFKPGDFTCVVRARTERQRNALLVVFGQMQTNAVGLRTDAGGQLAMVRWRGGKAYASRPASVADPVRTYHTYALVHDSVAKTMALVADAELVDTVPCEDASYAGFQFGEAVDGISDGESFLSSQMCVDEFRVYRKALSAGRIGDLYRAPAAEAHTFCRYLAENPFEVATVALSLALLIAAIGFHLALARHRLRVQRLFFSAVSHDIRTPLNAILGFAELLDGEGVAPEEVRRYAGIIRSSGKVLERLVDDILDIAKLEGGKLDLRNEPTDVPALVREVAASFGMASARKNLAFAVDAAEMPRLFTDPQRVRQFLCSLLDNAIKYTECGSVTVRAAWRHGTLDLAVADTGKGIASADIKRILHPFEQVADRNHRDGTGLGLAICNRLARRMGGCLSVRSEVGKGSTFAVSLPCPAVAEPDDAPVAVPPPVAEAPADPSAPVGAARHILVVDDSRVNVSVLKALLRKIGQNSVLTAGNGREALEVLKAHPEVDLVLTDLWMPELDGAELLKAIRADAARAGLAVCLVTADVDAQRNYANSGFTRILLKPITGASLASVLKV